jgi:pilus assembly protein Flp/PilA
MRNIAVSVRGVWLADTREPRETIMPLFRRFFQDQSGVAAIEYGLIAALIAVVIIGAVTTLGTNLSAKFQTVADKLS